MKAKSKAVYIHNLCAT